ncbi:MAG: hypothetical protein WBF33_24635, partial [Candidatus Nitrosopolaris sp.]
VLEFICCCCATAVDGIVIIIATANMMAVASNRFLIGGNLRIIHQIYSYAWKIRVHHHADRTVLQEYRSNMALSYQGGLGVFT